ncbi:MAG: hypothetical protein QNJ73_10200, partial [Gammaproteobacteria bacterium]|nr:hypothetical protein [Gammaproteobacteria bacterium]
MASDFCHLERVVATWSCAAKPPYDSSIRNRLSPIARPIISVRASANRPIGIHLMDVDLTIAFFEKKEVGIWTGPEER